MTDRCTCCDLPVQSCGHAADQAAARQRKALRQQALAEPGVVPAQHPGRCPGCDTKFLPGEPIRKGPDGWHGVLCCLPLDL